MLTNEEMAEVEAAYTGHDLYREFCAEMREYFSTLLDVEYCEQDNSYELLASSCYEEYEWTFSDCSIATVGKVFKKLLQPYVAEQKQKVAEAKQYFKEHEVKNCVLEEIIAEGNKNSEQYKQYYNYCYGVPVINNNIVNEVVEQLLQQVTDEDFRE